MSGNPDRASGIPDPASEILDAMGIAEPTRSELLRMAHVTEGYLQKWLAWYASQDRFGPGWAVTHIRDGAPAPRSRRDRQPAGRRAYLVWAANSQ